MKHLMIDIETLGTDPRAIVPQVGWCMFDHEDIAKPITMCLDMDEQIAKGRTFSADTLKWWMQQPDIAREQVFMPEKVYPVVDLETRLRTIIHSCGIEYVWAHGPHFDIAALKDLLGCEPWHYRSIRDTRTLADLAPSAHKPAPITKHDAGDDAYAQAQWVQNIWRSIGWPHGWEQGQ